MGRKPLWWQFVEDAVGMPELIAFIVGIPTVITVIATVWNALSWQQQIIVSICGILILGAIVLFIFGHTRKVLYKIPPLLYEMRRRYMELANNLKVDMSIHEKALELLLFDTPEKFINTMQSKIEVNDSENPKSIAKAIDDSVSKQIKQKIASDPVARDRISEYYCQASGLDNALYKDKQYTSLKNNLEKLRVIIPTEEISVAVNKYLKQVRQYSGQLPIQACNKNIADELPLKSAMDTAIWPSNMENELSKSLATVREAIDRHYKAK